MPFLLREVYQSLRQQKLRSALTGFGILWGVFLLILLLGVGDGFQRGTRRKFAGYTQNAVWFWGGRRNSGERALFDAQLIKGLEKQVSSVAYASPVHYSARALPVAFQTTTCQNASVRGVQPQLQHITQLALAEGRFFSQRDVQANRPVCVIGHDIYNVLLEKEASPIGTFISIDGSWFQVIGILDPDSVFNRDEQRTVFVPFDLFCKTFNTSPSFFHFRTLLYPGAQAQLAEQQIRAYLNTRMRLAPDNKQSLYCFNLGKQVQDFDNLFYGLRIFLWVVGTCMMLSGLVGVSNMMLVVVKERTKEIGVRKVMGASTTSITAMILLETLLVSLGAGGLGMALGATCIQLLNYLLSIIDPNQQLMIAALSFNPQVALGALSILALAGSIAGLIPARIAVAIRPVEALNTE